MLTHSALSLLRNVCVLSSCVYRSGSSANLEMALQVAAQGIKPVNKVLFAFWGAEELGLLGSYHFVKNQNEDGGVDDIALYLNFDMIVSVESHHTHTHTHMHSLSHTHTRTVRTHRALQTISDMYTTALR